MQALESLPEHLLLRVLRAWAASLDTQLSILPRRLRRAALAAAHASIDSQRSLTLPELRPASFRRAVRAVAELAALRRVDTVTLTPPDPTLDTGPPRPSHDQHAYFPQCRWQGPGARDHLLFAARHLRHLSALTALHLVDQESSWSFPAGCAHRLSCIASMPHIQVLGMHVLHASDVRAVVQCVAPMPQLQELHLGADGVRLLDRDGAWGGAAVVAEVCALTSLHALRLSIRYKSLRSPVDSGGVLTALAALLRGLRCKVVSWNEHGWSIVPFKGERPPEGLLGALRAAAPGLDMARCTVEESGEFQLAGMSVAWIDALWFAAMDDSAIAVERLMTSFNREGTRFSLDEFGDQYIAIPAARLASLPSLQALLVQSPHALDRSVALALGRQLPALTALTNLNFGNQTLSNGVAATLLPRLSALTALKDLAVRCCCIGPQGGVALAAALPPLHALTNISLGRNDLGGRGAAAIMSAVSTSAAARLKVLDLSYNLIGPEGFAAVARRLPELSSLAELHLGANLGSEDGVAELLRALTSPKVRSMTALEVLKLERNFLECSGAAVVAQMLPHLPRLENLDLASNAIGAIGIRALARRLPRMPSLLNLSMGFNCVGDIGARALARCMLPTLGFVQLQHNGIGDAGALALGERVCELTRFCQPEPIYVHLEWNRISARVWYSVQARSARASTVLTGHHQNAYICDGDCCGEVGIHDILSEMDV